MESNSCPKLRLLDTQWIEHMGKPALLLQDRLALSARAVVVPQVLAPLLALLDGTRDPAGVQSAMELWTGVRLDISVIERVVSQLDDAVLLDNERYAAAYRQARVDFRAAPFRPATLAGLSYPEEPSALAAMVDRWLDGPESDGHEPAAPAPLRGLVCPHIDYERGGPIYGRVWARAREELADADSFLILGTDHAGGPAELTLTRQSYQTPFGLLRTDVEAVDRVAEAIGPEAAFRSELNHRGEHSIELAAVWLRYLAGSRDVRIVPVLCGSFHPFTHGGLHPSRDDRWQAVIEVLRQLAGRGRTQLIVAADLDHVGPAFGDSAPVSEAERADVSAFDDKMLGTICRGDAEAFLGLLAAQRDRTHVCGLPPIYLALQTLESARGEVVDYSQCPAPSGSIVSVAGVLLR